MSGEDDWNMKDRPAVHIYLPEDIRNKLDIVCQTVNLTYQRETNEKLGKNRYLYPIVLRAGLDDAVDLSAEEIKELKEEIDDAEGIVSD